MKWIAVILVMLNLIVFLLMKSYPDAVQPVAEGDFETINEAAMSVLPPQMQLEPVAVESADLVEGDLVEDGLAQLKVDDRGKVLMAVNTKSDATKESGNSKQATGAMPVLQPLDRAETPASASGVSPAGSGASVVSDAPETRSQAKSRPKPEPVLAAVSPEPEPAVVEVAACYRIGPFSNQKQLANIRHKLENADIEHSVEEKTDPDKIKAVRVYLGAFSDEATLNAEKARLSKMKIDHIGVALDGKRLIQLGYFSKPAGAKRFQQSMLARNIAAKTMTEYKDTRIESWLSLKPVIASEVDKLGLPSGMVSRSKDCR